MQAFKFMTCIKLVEDGKMAIEWTAETDVLTCSKCGESINPGETVIGDLDKFFHKDGENCHTEEE